MSQKNQGNKQSEREGADRGHPGRTEKVSGIERVGSHHSSGGVSFNVPNHPDKSEVSHGPGGKMDE